jgi:hypothetical protein
MRAPRHTLARLTAVAVSALLLATVLIISACTGEPPEIVQVFWQLKLVQDREQDLTYQTLSLFVRPNDPDGFEDIEDVYLINDDQELFWRLDVESWVQSGSEEEIWIGSNSLKMPDGASFPAGRYRILLRDVGGESAEQTIRLQLISRREASRYLPEVEIADGRIRVSGQAPGYQLWVYNNAGRYINTYPGTTAAASILQGRPELEQGFTFDVYAFLADSNLGVESGPYYFRP